MHEASLVKALLRQVAQLLQEHGASSVTQVNVKVGEFSGCDPDLLALAFERERESAAIGAARLNVSRALLAGECNQCTHNFVIEHFRFVCPLCASTEVNVTGGEELLLESVTMEFAA
jgi:hydrogenase nickel incorporation protein HypA/HybF